MNFATEVPHLSGLDGQVPPVILPPIFAKDCLTTNSFWIILFRKGLGIISLPYIINCCNWLEPEDGFKVKIALQGTLDPIQPQAKKTFVNSVRAINQAGVV